MFFGLSMLYLANGVISVIGMKLSVKGRFKWVLYVISIIVMVVSASWLVIGGLLGFFALKHLRKDLEDKELELNEKGALFLLMGATLPFVVPIGFAISIMFDFNWYKGVLINMIIFLILIFSNIFSPLCGAILLKRGRNKGAVYTLCILTAIVGLFPILIFSSSGILGLIYSIRYYKKKDLEKEGADKKGRPSGPRK